MGLCLLLSLLVGAAVSTSVFWIYSRETHAKDLEGWMGAALCGAILGVLATAITGMAAVYCYLTWFVLNQEGWL